MARIPPGFAGVASLLYLVMLTVDAQRSVTSPLSTIQTLDCYSSAGNLKSLGVYTFQSSGYCQQQCAGQNALVMGTSDGSTCYCGNDLPSASDIVDRSECNEPCDGYPQENCGGNDHIQIYLTGLGTPGIANDNSSTLSMSGDSLSGTSIPPSVITKVGQTTVVTAPASSKSSVNAANSSGHGVSKTGIVVGVITGGSAVALIVGAIIFFFKRCRDRALGEDPPRNAAVSSFFVGRTSVTLSTDHRLDPAIFSHRQSIGSIDDERDFSRRLLQVRNPDRESRASTTVTTRSYTI